jgi:hypothetical protein
MLLTITSKLLEQPPQECWSEQEELDYIEHGEPLNALPCRQPSFRIPARRQHARTSVITFVPFLMIVWIFHPIHEYVTGMLAERHQEPKET